MSRTFYMHLIDGNPATFDGNQICAAGRYGRGKCVNFLVGSLKEIMEHQKASVIYRREKLGDANASTAPFSYVRYQEPKR